MISISPPTTAVLSLTFELIEEQSVLPLTEMITPVGRRYCLIGTELLKLLLTNVITEGIFKCLGSLDQK